MTEIIGIIIIIQLAGVIYLLLSLKGTLEAFHERAHNYFTYSKKITSEELDYLLGKHLSKK